MLVFVQTDKFSYLNKYRKLTMKFWWQPLYLFSTFLVSFFYCLFLCLVDYDIVDSYFAIFIMLFCLQGAYVSRMVLTTEENRVPYDGEDVTTLQMVLGGFLVMFGARLAGGCTSGHGISGVSNLCWRSFASIGTMFGGAILTGKNTKQ